MWLALSPTPCQTSAGPASVSFSVVVFTSSQTPSGWEALALAPPHSTVLSPAPQVAVESAAWLK